ncbi:gag-proteinase polyprotein [Cucumis melo var. makuwa]|uniref:Gag-proteinase polyprotein n=1 Tax=Cucumis melo var. makuwa TaxID=1194695 RepID=A0A5A7TLW7_CUCMM|nr:gag-proteinase polyprotein [Cucumis melo var. makuwa]
MEAFLMSLNMRSWRAVISRWEYPTEKDEVGQTVRKSEMKWTKDEDDAAVGNSRALNALFNAVNLNIFKLINTCKSAKVAWDILEVAFEGTSKLKISWLQILTSPFEALQMGEDETIAEFNVRVLEIANKSDALREKMSDSRLVRKVLRSLPSKFNMKVTAIEEANDLSKMKLDELFGSLRTFEIHLGHTANIRKSRLALTSVKEEPIEEHRVMQVNDALTESVVMLTKHVVKLKNQFHKHMGNQRNNREDLSLNESRISDTSSSEHYRKKEHERGKGIEVLKSDKYGKGIMCHECEGFGHIQAECATYLKRKKKGLVATFSDEEDYSESDDEDLGMALISICTMNDEENVQTHDQSESKNLTDDAADRKKTKDQEVILQQ